MAKLLFHLVHSILIYVSQFSLLEPSKYYDNTTIDDFGGNGSNKSEPRVAEIVKNTAIDIIADTIFSSTPLNHTSNESHQVFDSGSRQLDQHQDMTSYRSGQIVLTNSALAFMVISCLLAGFIVATVVFFIFWFFYLKPQYENQGSPNVPKKRTTYETDPKERTSYHHCLNQAYPKDQVDQTHTKQTHDLLYKEPKDLDDYDNEDITKRNQVDDDVLEVPIINNGDYGLGFSIYTDANNGIYVKNATPNLARNLSPGDRIISVKVNCEKILYEDALTILNYASPYPMILEITKNKSKVKQRQTNSEYRNDSKNLIEQYLEIIPRKSKSLENMHNYSLEEIYTHRKSLSENDLSMLIISRDVTPTVSSHFTSSNQSSLKDHVIEKYEHMSEKHANKANRKSKSEEDFRQFFIHNHNHMQFRKPYLYPDSDSKSQVPPNRDSGLGDSHNRNEFLVINRLQYEKLAYFRDQLLLQQNDLKSMNLAVPDPPRMPNMQIDDFEDD